MDIRIFTCIHGRQELTKLFVEHIRSLREATGKKLPITLAYTEDADLDNIKGLLTKADQAVKAANKPLSYKHNAGMDELLKETKESHVLHLGSDDFCTKEYIEYLYQNPMDFGGIQGIYFANTQTKEAKVCRYFKNKKRSVIGAGRLFSRNMLEETRGYKYTVNRTWYSFRKGDTPHIPDRTAEKLRANKVIDERAGKNKRCALWMHRADMALDMMSGQVLKDLGYVPTVFDKDFDAPQIVDVKTGENITSYARLKGEAVDYNEATAILGELKL